jgi:hypothetical protein
MRYTGLEILEAYWAFTLQTLQTGYLGCWVHDKVRFDVITVAGFFHHKDGGNRFFTNVSTLFFKLRLIINNKLTIKYFRYA